MLEVIPGLCERFPELFVIHQTGFADYDLVVASYASHGLKVKVFPFIKDMARAYAQADLVVCRAGATTIAELCALGKPAIYIPFPYATHNHQERNARVVVERGAGLMFRQREVSSEELFKAISELLHDEKRRRRMGEAARRIFPENPLQIIFSEMEALLIHARA
jgi:UDP-N-acetylglucosamine--N-acetylmuramyl-(pentapeptide) pyrophosphoryl-undecaprenol N-acetylglucosamine transferase